MTDEVAPDSYSSFADRVVEQLRHWPALRVAADGAGTVVRTADGGTDILHLGASGEAGLRLTWKLIQRLGETLTENGRVRTEPGSDWIYVRLRVSGDARLLISLVSLAIREHAATPAAPAAPDEVALSGSSPLEDRLARDA
jgi:hypothetical protein